MPHQDLGDLIRRYEPKDVAGLPKYARLREALLNAIQDGCWEPLDQLPREITLAEVTPYSLGTVQKALRELVQRGVVIRQQGRGTFVAKRSGPMREPRNLRFEDDDGNQLPLVPHIIHHETLNAEGKWNRLLGPGVRRIAHIDRVFQVADKFHCFSRFYIDADRYRLFAGEQLANVQSVNFKDILRREYNVTIQRTARTTRVAAFSPAICEAINVASGTVGAIVDFVAYAGGDSPIYIQEAFIPPNPYRLRLEE